MADVDDKNQFIEGLSEEWALLISQHFDGVRERDITSLSNLRRQIRDEDKEKRLRKENEIEDIEFRLKRGSKLGRFDQFWDDHTLFNCRYSRSKWLNLRKLSTVPLEVYSHALKGNKNITHIAFRYMGSDFDVNLFLCDLPWVTSITPDRSVVIPSVPRDLLFIKSTNNVLNTFAKEIKLVPSSTFIFLDAEFFDVYPGKLTGNARVSISFVAPTSGKSLTLRVKHSGKKDAHLEVTLGSTKFQLNPPSRSSFTDISLYPIEASDPPISEHLSFVAEVRSDIFIRFSYKPANFDFHGHYLHDIELLDDAGMEYMLHSASLSLLSI